ncbi:hypothetical protein [Ideonella paludis]|uniref:hypothetical protein n=1 Tax=Ideonella paludis TaxID=1233411 RepID=UPI00363ED601
MKTIRLQLSAGLLLLAPLLAAALRDNKDQIARARDGLISDPVEFIELTVSLAHASAKRLDPSITRERIEELVDMENVQRVFSACFGVSIPESSPGKRRRRAAHRADRLGRHLRPRHSPLGLDVGRRRAAARPAPPPSPHPRVGTVPTRSHACRSLPWLQATTGQPVGHARASSTLALGHANS